MASRRITAFCLVIWLIIVAVEVSALEDKRFLISEDAISCNFEAGFCRYSTSGSKISWSMGSSNLVGSSMPVSDHTYLSNKVVGHYLYVMPSSTTASGSAAKLTSRVLATSQNSMWSLRFWYFMHGNDPGTLNVYFKHQGQPASSVFSETGDHGSRWFEACLDVQFRSLQVEFEAITGSVGTGNIIAIDDVEMRQETCDSSHAQTTHHVMTTPHYVPTTHAQSAVSVSCTFESTDICGYTQDRADNFDWSRHRGPTSSLRTGPDADHTTGHGYYMYIETSSPRRTGEHARLISPSFSTDSHPTSLEFWYNMHGGDIGILNVYLDSGHPLVFTDNKATNTSMWQRACIAVPANSNNIRVEFEGITGNGSIFTGDIAIDDVTLSSGTCISGSASTTHSPVATHSTSTDGHWSSWGSWSSCAVTCGTGIRASHRLCNNPAPANGGHTCAGYSMKPATCKYDDCVVNGGWSAWSTWSKCTLSCGIGQLIRHRSCNSPAPSGGGVSCSGDATETHDCSMGPCPQWTHWVESTCSSSCGNGTFERMRQCSTGQNADCIGNSYETIPCVGPECIA